MSDPAHQPEQPQQPETNSPSQQVPSPEELQRQAEQLSEREHLPGAADVSTDPVPKADAVPAPDTQAGPPQPAPGPESAQGASPYSATSRGQALVSQPTAEHEPPVQPKPAEVDPADPKPPEPRIKIGSQRDEARRSQRPAYRPPQEKAPPQPPPAASEKPQGGKPVDHRPLSKQKRDRQQGEEQGPTDYDAKQRAEDIPGQNVAQPFTRGGVPIPSRRQKAADIEAELEAAMGEVSLDDIVAQAEQASGETQLARGTKVKAQIVAIHEDDVFVDLSVRNQGVVPLKSFAEKDQQPEIGQEIDVTINRFHEDDGLYYCNLPGAAMEAVDWSILQEGEIVEARVTGTNKGGLELAVGNARGFMPAGQVSIYRVENLETMVGEKLTCLITQCQPERKNLVLSRRALMEREKAEAEERLREELEEGQIREGVVRNIRDFGAFVDLGGLDGLVHIGQMSWARIRHPSEILTVGQKVKVKITKIDPASGKISLSLRDLQQDPWTEVAMKYPVGEFVRGTVTRTAQFGAFVELEPGIEGLIHISELDAGRVWRVTDVVNDGDEVEVKITSIEPEKRRIGLSRKAVLAAAAPPPKSADEQESQPQEPEQEPYKPKRKGPLKGGLGRPSGGDDIGLNL